MVPASLRLPEGPALVERGAYFVIHAPRQTGKTTALRELATALTGEGKHAALLFSCEAARVFADDVNAAELAILAEIEQRANIDLPLELQPPKPWPPESPEGTKLRAALTRWARTCPRPLALFFDEIDSLAGRSLLSVLSQLRQGYSDRPEAFPWAVALCGLRDVRDYKAASGGAPDRMGTSSPFNIKVESLRIGDFREDELRQLYAQHTADTGQRFDEDAMKLAFDATAGQPWLANALAREVVEKMKLDPSDAITAADIDTAKERLILTRATHLDSLVARLQEPRVRRIVEPVIAGAEIEGDPFNDDFQYAQDLGLVARTAPARIANPIYREVIVRVLALAADANFTIAPRAYVLPSGALDMDRLLSEFAAFWRENGETIAANMPYHEVAPQLVLMAYLQRVVNGGGYVDREYGVGRGRIDLLIRWPYTTPSGERAIQREALELKVWRDGKADPLAEGLVQLEAYLDRMSLDHGALVIFDRRATGQAIDVRTKQEEAKTASGKSVVVLRA
jgi:hypothetical protein